MSLRPSSAGSSEATSSSLLQRAKDADPEAWNRLLQLYGPVVYRWTRQVGVSADDAPDIVQDVFHALAAHLGDFRRKRTGDSFRGWLWTITRNKVHDHFRRLQGKAQAVGGTDAYRLISELPAEPPDIASESGIQERNGLRRRAVELVRAEFEPQTWQAFWRTVVAGEKPAHVAADLGISVWAVYKARSRILQRLRDEFQDLMG